ncbi:MAG: NAD-dependent epimerase/dehydratase family protein [Chitinophagaceae bacterium]|nr:MAG: NAD-dependent epimerase/dehydratase family protein [Chitinophagaceae bacterium]
MRHFLVTGAAGFIGSNLVKKLLHEDDVSVTGIDNFDPFYDRDQKRYNLLPLINHPRFNLLEGDIRDAALLQTITEEPCCIIHLAAKAGVRPSIKDPVLYHEVNNGGTQALLEFANNRNITQFVFASSSSVYGVNQHLPWTETEALLPISPYAASKFSGEMLGHVYSHLYKIRFVALRFFTVYGPGQRPDLAIHKFFRSIMDGQPIPVYGDGSTSRDYTYVDDIVSGIISAVNYDQSFYEIINIGNHHVVSLQELITAVEETCGKKAIIDRQPEQPGDVPATYADISKAKRLLGYSPSTKLKDGLAAFYLWLKDFREWKGALRDDKVPAG